MKKAHVFTLTMTAVMSLCGLVGCSKKSSEEEGEFSFSVAIEGDYQQLEVRSTPYKLNVMDNGIKTEGREYTFTSSNPSVASIVSTTGYITALTPGTVRFTVSESSSGLDAFKVIEVIPESPKAKGGYNFSAATTPAQIEERTNILGKLEKYAMDSHLTGISLFENGGYQLFSSRARNLLPTQDYITGYGFGLLSDSSAAFTTKLSGSGADNEFPYHYHTASSSDPGSINAFDNVGSQVSDLSSYISSSYFSMKINSSKNGADWYPVLADETIHVTDPVTKTPKMFHTGAHNGADMYTGWRIYVKANSEDLKYRHNGSEAMRAEYDGRKVQLEDYEFILRFLLTGGYKLKRGTEMAGDTSYGIKGAAAYYKLTDDKNIGDQEAEDLWNSLKASKKLGVKTGHCTAGSEVFDEGGENEGFFPEGDYIEFTLLNPIDAFSAMYTLSSSLYSPIPKSFMQEIGKTKEGVKDNLSINRAAKRYGGFNMNDTVPASMKNNIVESTICLGAYYLDKWEKGSRTVFTHNKQWFEYPDRYKIDGVRIKIDEAMAENPDAYYEEFTAGNLDSCSLPQKHMDRMSEAIKTKGDSVFKLNVNACTQEQWTDRFGPNGSIDSGHNWEVKPWMSNDNFLNGLFWSIDRKAFAEKRGVQPSINYFSDAYMSNPQMNVSYNSTEHHKNAVKNYHNVRYDSNGNVIEGSDDYGYNKDTAINYFKTAVAQLVKQGKLNYGTVDNPKEIKIEIWWMYQSDITEYGVDIKNYFETAFNDNAVSGKRIKLNVINNAVTVWDYVYDQHLMVGEFDLGFGAISGNTYNPLNFLEVLKSDNSSGFTLNWGVDTSKVDDKRPLVYNDQKYSFDGLWEVADHGGVIDSGESVRPFNYLYLDNFDNLDVATGDSTVKLYHEFPSVGSSVVYKIVSVAIYVYGGGNFSSDDPTSGVTYNPSTKKITISSDGQDSIVESIKDAIKYSSMTSAQQAALGALFRRNYYKVYWTVDVTYSLSINGGQETYNTIAAGKTESEDIYEVIK